MSVNHFSDPMPDKIPDHVSLDKNSPHHFHFWKKVGVKIDGRVVFTCLEFCVSERWARMGLTLPNGRFKTERGKTVSIMLQDVTVEPYWR